MDTPKEWKPIVMCPQYVVSNKGEIKNLKTGRILKSFPARHGYLYTSVDFPDGTRKRLRIAREVTRAFIGERPESMQINHKNGIKTDNRIENLEYVSPSDNLRHAANMGFKRGNKHLFKKGEPKRKSNLSDDEIRSILLKWKETGFGAIRLAPIVGFSVSAVSNVIDKNKKKKLKAELGM